MSMLAKPAVLHCLARLLVSKRMAQRGARYFTMKSIMRQSILSPTLMHSSMLDVSHVQHLEGQQRQGNSAAPREGKVN